jgi:hypothetical protein
VETGILPQNIPMFCFRDNGANTRTSIRNSGGWYDASCFPHTLQMAIGDAKAASDGIETGSSNAKKILNLFHHANAALTSSTDREIKLLLQWSDKHNSVS